MGRPRKPVDVQIGNLTTEQRTTREQEEAIITIGKEQLKKSPDWLIDDIARKEYKRIVKQFDKIGIVGNLDLNNLGGYCNAYSFYLRSTEELKDQPLTMDKKLPNGATVIAENPLIKIQKSYADEMRKFSSICGLTIDSRLKAASFQIKKSEQSIETEFGNI